MNKQLKVSQISATENSINDYRRRVKHFIDSRSLAIHAAMRDSTLARWNFYQQMSEVNQAKSNFASNKYSQMGQDASVYAELCELKADCHFSTLDFVSRRSLEVSSAFFNANMPVAGKGGEDVRLREVLEARTSELSRYVNSMPRDELLAGTADGVTAPFAELLRELVIQRNQLAQMRGYSNYYCMCLGSDAAYAQMRSQLKELKIALEPIFTQCKHSMVQEGEGNGFSLVKLPSERKLTRSILMRTGELLGLSTSSLEGILAASSVHPREMKNSHCFLFAIDSPFDVRGHLNIPEDADKIDARHIQSFMLHEVIGHGVDYASIRSDLPAPLRSHRVFSTEVMAMLLERLAYEPRWLQLVGGLDAKAVRQLQQEVEAQEFKATLTSMRNQIQMVEFEASMYENPTQDLDMLHYQLMLWYCGYNFAKEFYAPGYWSLSVSHYLHSPCYCQNYVLGTAWAMQVREALRRKFGSFVSRRVGPYLAKRRRNGLLYTPEEQLVQLTGESFSSNVVIQALTRLLPSAQKAGFLNESASAA